VREGKLFDRALRLLVERQLVVVEVDDFGPPLVLPAEDFGDAWRETCADPLSPFGRYMRVGKTKDRWLREALEKLADEERRLHIQESDYDDPAAEWAPIPVDRDQPELQEVIAAVDDAAEKIGSDNGYTATRTEERNYVVDSLAAFRKRIKEATTISLPYIRQFAIDPLMRAGTYLGRNATGLAIEVAKARIRAWLMKVGIPWPFNWPNL